MIDQLLNYLGNQGGTLGTPANIGSPAAANQPPPNKGGFMQNFGGAVGRSQQAGGGLTGLVAALSPGFAQGFNQNKPAQPQQGGKW